MTSSLIKEDQNFLRYRKGCHRCGADGHLARDCPIWNSEEHKLYVKGLPKTYSNLDVTELFSEFGKIIRCTVLLSKKKEDYGRHLGCALVTYASKDAAHNAVEKMHNSKILKGADRPLQVTFGGVHHHDVGGGPPGSAATDEDDITKDMKGPVCYKCGDGGHVARECPVWETEGFSERRLYVKGLPKAFTDQNVYHLFAPFGKVLKCHVLYHKQTGEPLGCALVTYAKTDSAHLAIDKLNNSTTMEGADRPLQVMFSARKEDSSISPTDCSSSSSSGGRRVMKEGFPCATCSSASTTDAMLGIPANIHSDHHEPASALSSSNASQSTNQQHPHHCSTCLHNIHATASHHHQHHHHQQQHPAATMSTTISSDTTPVPSSLLLIPKDNAGTAVALPSMGKVAGGPAALSAQTNGPTLTNGLIHLPPSAAPILTAKNNACYICSATGHFARECPLWEERNAGGGSTGEVRASGVRGSALMVADAHQLLDDPASCNGRPEKPPRLRKVKPGSALESCGLMGVLDNSNMDNYRCNGQGGSNTMGMPGNSGVMGLPQSVLSVGMPSGGRALDQFALMSISGSGGAAGGRDSQTGCGFATGSSTNNNSITSIAAAVAAAGCFDNRFSSSVAGKVGGLAWPLQDSVMGGSGGGGSSIITSAVTDAAGVSAAAGGVCGESNENNEYRLYDLFGSTGGSGSGGLTWLPTNICTAFSSSSSLLAESPGGAASQLQQREAPSPRPIPATCSNTTLAAGGAGVPGTGGAPPAANFYNLPSLPVFAGGAGGHGSVGGGMQSSYSSSNKSSAAAFDI